MKSILFIINSLGGGGAEKTLIDLLSVIDYNQYSVDLLLVNYEGIYIDEVKKINENIKLNYIYEPVKIKNSYVNEIIQFFRGKTMRLFAKMYYRKYVKKNYDIEIAFLEGFPSTYLLANSTNSTSKKIAWVHTDLEKSRTMSFENEDKMYDNIDKIICVSNDCKRVFSSLYPKHIHKLEVLHNFIDRKKIINLAKEEDCSEYTDKTIVAVGRLVKEKRFDLLIKACYLLLKEKIEVNLVIVGDGPLYDELNKEIGNLGISKNIKLVGFKKNPYPYIYNSKVFVVSSDFEGFSLVVAEAISLGKAIVSTKCTGPMELLDNGETGFLVDCGDEVQLKEAIKLLLLDENIRNKYEYNANRKSSEFIVDEYIMKLNKILLD